MSGNKSSDRAIVRWGVADRQLSQGERWMALACLFFFAFVTNLGSFYSGPFGAMADGMGWQQAGLVGLLPIAAVFTVLCLIFVKSERSILKKEEGQA